MISAIAAPITPSYHSPSKLLEGRVDAPSIDKKNVGTDPGKINALSEEEKAVVEKLKKTDQEVRTHEQAHKNAGGQYAGSASFGYQAGPDGRRYAVSGEVSIDIAQVKGDPEATIAKMNVVIAAALAPSEPSGQDRRVAAQAAALRASAQAELSIKNPSDVSGQKQEINPKNKNAIKFGNESGFSVYQAASDIASHTNNSGNIINLFS